VNWKKTRTATHSYRTHKCAVHFCSPGGVWRSHAHVRSAAAAAAAADTAALLLMLRIMELSILITFAPRSESTMVWNFRSLELSLPGTKVPRTFAPTPVAPNPKWLSVATFVHGYVRIGLRGCVNLHPSFNVCFTKALYRRLNYFSITHTHTFYSFTCVMSSLSWTERKQEQQRIAIGPINAHISICKVSEELHVKAVLSQRWPLERTQAVCFTNCCDDVGPSPEVCARPGAT